MGMCDVTVNILQTSFVQFIFFIIKVIDNFNQFEVHENRSIFH